MAKEPTTRQRATALDSNAIEQTLNDLWREHADAARQGEPMGARARLANLVTYSRTDEEDDRAAAVVAELNASRPVRSIRILAKPRAEAVAGASIQCRPGGARPICYEEVTLRLPDDARDALPSLIEPLTVTDLPTFLWFPGDPPLDEEPVLRLIPFVDRVVTDSHGFSNNRARFAQLQRLVGEHRPHTVFTEMTWTRLGTWREAVGKMFDPESSRAFLGRIREVTLTSVAGVTQPSDRALLMVGWLAAKLGWRPVGYQQDQPLCARYEAAQGPVTVAFETGTATGRGHLLRLEMRAGDVVFRVNRRRDDPSGAIESATVCSGDVAHGPAYHPRSQSLSELLCYAMEIRSPYTDWEETLAAVAGLEG